ncbi:MAG TPA: serine hydrolase [Cyanobacteria bacterium UBA8543]|nr:serine hydrolase [Cyanobacteria bacterium UBA8543]
MTKASGILYAVLVELILIWLLSGLPCFAQGMPTPQPGLTNPQELEIFLDKFFAQQMTKGHVPGAVFALVKDGKIFFSKGYGYADLEKKIPVVPDKTLFRVGSISKLFTATAVMQLAEQNKLKLDDDVNKYLKRFQIEKSYNKPVTLANLLTHTDGFDSGWGIKAFARSASEMTPLGDFIAKRLPPRILPPGEVFLYSDVGMNLAGYLVEVISGVPFAKYVDQNILQPLDMRRTSFFQPLPPQLAADLAVGYKYKNGTYQGRPFAFSNTIPGNALMATATDIAHFAIAHLQNGRYGEARILNESTAQLMHRQHFAHYPGMVGSAYGFVQRMPNQQRAIMHSGRHSGYTSQLYLLPDQNLGFFVACNNNPTSLTDELVKQFFDHYYPVEEKPAPVPQRITSSQEHLQKLAGTYRYNRYPHHTIEKLAAVFGEAPEVRTFAGNDGTLSLYVPEFKSVEIKPLLFRFFYSNDRMTFRQDGRGGITHMFISDSVFAALEKLAWYETLDFQLKLLIFCTLVFFLTCIVQLISGLVRRIRKQKSKTSKLFQLAQLLAVLISTLNLIFLIGIGWVLSQADFWELFFGLPTEAIAFLYIPPITTGLTFLLPILIALNWKNQYWSGIKQLHYSLITLAAIGFVSFLNYWNLLGFRF